MKQNSSKGEKVQLQAILHDEMLRLNRLVSTHAGLFPAFKAG